jgi:hypothetical protein
VTSKRREKVTWTAVVTVGLLLMVSTRKMMTTYMMTGKELSIYISTISLKVAVQGPEGFTPYALIQVYTYIVTI